MAFDVLLRLNLGIKCSGVVLPTGDAQTLTYHCCSAVYREGSGADDSCNITAAQANPIFCHASISRQEGTL